MQVEIKNCNNINTASIEIKKNKLNIKYGINGTGKSTIAKAIEQKIEGNDLLGLKPYNTDDTISPEVIGIDELHSIKVYDDDYISKYLFLPNGENLHKDAFEVFIKPNDYEEKVESISNDLSALKKIIDDNEDINKYIVQFEELNKIIGISKTKTGEMSIKTTSGLGRALTQGNKIVDIPDILSPFSDFLGRKNRVMWHKWQSDGREFVTNNKCPYCSNKLNNNYNDITIALDAIFDKKNAEVLLKMENIIDAMTDILSEETIKIFKSIITNAEPASDDNKRYVLKFYNQINKTYDNFLKIRQLNYKDLSNIDDLNKELLSLEFNLDDLNGLFTEKFISTISEINNNLNNLFDIVEQLNTKINDLKEEIISYSNANITIINEFLDSVGMNYEVRVENDSLLLYGKNSTTKVDALEHLSWGERNSFALSLFLFDCLHNNPDLIILDDPVSSFDFNKRYAIMYYLFGNVNNDNLRNKTVLMLTHDLEPLVDMVKVKGDYYPDVYACYIENIKGTISEKHITKNEINSVINISLKICKQTNINVINKLIHLRRYLELNHDKNKEYGMISSLFHGSAIPNYRVRNGKVDLVGEEFNNVQASINSYVNGFDYNSLLSTLKNANTMKQIYNETTNNYEKIELFRIISDIFSNDFCIEPVIGKFINEAYHIENTYIFQLDPYAYNMVPDYIVQVCDSMMSKFNN